MNQLKILDPFEQSDQVKSIWVGLQESASHSFFNSWGWVETWLNCIPAKLPLRCVVALDGDIPQAAFFIGRAPRRRTKLLRKSCAFFNETGNEIIDDLTIEYNAAVGVSPQFAVNELFADAAFDAVEEFQFSALAETAYEGLDFPSTAFSAEVRRFPSYFIDLKLVRENRQSYIDCLSGNKRNQIRRSLRAYEQQGELELHRAASIGEALQMLEDLKELHQKEWNRRGKPGAFSGEFFLKFHRALIESRFAHGEIELLKVSSGAMVIGYLYNFVYQNETLYYQSGLNYGKSNRERPGLICHYQAINHSLERGRDRYNFLGGESAYKQSLSTSADTLYSVRVVRQNFKWTLEQLLRRLSGRVVEK